MDFEKNAKAVLGQKALPINKNKSIIVYGQELSTAQREQLTNGGVSVIDRLTSDAVHAAMSNPSATLGIGLLSKSPQMLQDVLALTKNMPSSQIAGLSMMVVTPDDTVIFGITKYEVKQMLDLQLKTMQLVAVQA